MNQHVTPTIHDRMTKLRSHYIGSKRFDRLGEHIDGLIKNAEACSSGLGSMHRALFVIGESGTGKTRALKEQFKSKPAFQPYENEFGEQVSPLLSLEAPSPCNTKFLAMAILHEMEIPVKSRATELELYNLLKRQFKERGVLYLHIDEMQHALQAETASNIQKLQNVLKSLTQIPGWPLHMIFSGVPTLALFLEGDRQLAKRSKVQRFDLLDIGSPQQVAFVRQTVLEIVCTQGEFKADFDKDETFYRRLIVAASGSFGTLIHTVLEVCSTAMFNEADAISVTNFAHAYHANTACLELDNVFTARNWERLIPANAITDLGEVAARRRRR